MQLPQLASLLVVLAALLGCVDGDLVALGTAPGHLKASASADPQGVLGRPTPTPVPEGPSGKSEFGPAPTPRFVEIVPFAGIVNAPYEDGTSPAGYPIRLPLTAKVHLSDGSSNALVTWSSDDRRRATVSAEGVVSAVVGAQPGSVTITARSTVDPTKANSVVIRVQTLGNAAITIR